MSLIGTADKGSGIGLALVKELVDLYRGQISVSSEPCNGSRFKVSLPFVRNSFNEEEMVYGEWLTEEKKFIRNSVDEMRYRKLINLQTRNCRCCWLWKITQT